MKEKERQFTVQVLTQSDQDGANLVAQLKGLGYQVLASFGIEPLFDAAVHGNPDLLILDDARSGLGIESEMRLFRRIPGLKNIPIIGLLSTYSCEQVGRLITLGMADFLVRPYTDEMLKLRIESILVSNVCQAQYNEMLQMRVDAMQDVQSVMIEGMATLAEFREPDTGGHIKRTQNYVKALAVNLRQQGRYVEELTDDVIDMMYLSVPLHDIGKVGIRDDILMKPGELTPEEFEIMKQHTIFGHEAILRTSGKLKDNAFLSYAADVAYTHQERWDGTGYPQGLKGKEIPLIGRLMAVADVYDALISKRVYKEAYDHEKAICMILEERGTHFDPEVVDVFLSISDIFDNIAKTYKDTEIGHRERMSFQNMISGGMIKNVLIVDDSRLARSLIANQLSNMGLEISLASDGQEALLMALQNHYDLMLTDIDMPLMDGLTFSRVYRLQTQHLKSTLKRHPIILALTASDYALTPEKAKADGLDGYLLKPLDMKRLETKLQQVFHL